MWCLIISVISLCWTDSIPVIAFKTLTFSIINNNFRSTFYPLLFLDLESSSRGRFKFLTSVKNWVRPKGSSSTISFSNCTGPSWDLEWSAPANSLSATNLIDETSWNSFLRYSAIDLTTSGLNNFYLNSIHNILWWSQNYLMWILKDLPFIFGIFLHIVAVQFTVQIFLWAVNSVGCITTAFTPWLIVHIILVVVQTVAWSISLNTLHSKNRASQGLQLDLIKTQLAILAQRRS